MLLLLFLLKYIVIANDVVALWVVTAIVLGVSVDMIIFLDTIGVV